MMEDQSESKWIEKKRSKPQKPEHLPSSSDTDFWGEDAEVHHIPTDENGRPTQGRVDMTTHRFVQRGQEIVCVGCPFEHSVPLDPAKFTVRDGQIIKTS